MIRNIVAEKYSKTIRDDQEVRLLSLSGSITGEVVANTFFGEEFCSYTINGMNTTTALVNLFTKLLHESF